MSKRIIKVLSISDKLKIIQEFQKGKTQDAIQKEFNVPRSTVSRIIKNCESIQEAAFEGQGKSKRLKKAEFPELEDKLVKWIKMCQSKNVPIGGNVIKEKAKQFALSLGIPNFSASNGWLEGFKKRHDLVFKKICGESNSVDLTSCRQWVEDLPNLLADYSADDIFNADETALFFKCLPDKTFTFKNMQCTGAKISKERVTLLLCANMSGTEKLTPLLIGKPARPRCFKNIKTFPVEYKNNKNAWMTSELFKDWLKKVDRQMSLNKRKILLFVDNCTAHIDIPGQLNYITIKFLPANTTSMLQPLDQGIIQNFKVLYRKQVVDFILNSIENDTSTAIHLLDAMRFSLKAWNSVSTTTIFNCFKKAGFKKNIPENVDAIECDLVEECQSVAVDDWQKIISDTTGSTPSFEDFVNVDVNIPICGELTDDDILASPSKSDDEDDDCELIDNLVSTNEALNAVKTLQRYFESNISNPDVFNKLNCLEKCIYNTQKKQTKITDFLN